MDYIDIVKETIIYIEDNLEQKITLDDLACNALFSKFHFHRIFQNVVGESVMEYIRKRRVSKAALKLIKTNEKIINIAMKYQFNSQDTFTRAFIRYFDLTPSRFRKQGKSIKLYERVNINMEDFTMFNWDLSNRIKCTENEKDECLELLSKILFFSQKAHKYGLLSLESEIDKCEDLFMEKGIQFIISGINPNYIKEILGTYIIVGNFTGKELLKRVIILEGILGIQRGESDYIIRERLSAYFGEDYLNKLKEYFGTDAENINNKIKTYFQKVKSKSPISSKTYLLEETIKNMDNRSIQRALRDIDVNDIVNALTGASGNVQISVLSNISKNVLLMIIDELDANTEIDNKAIVESQQKIISIIHKLKEDKEIR